MAKRNASKKSRGIIASIASGLRALWRAMAKTLGAAIRTVTRSAKDLDPEHQRDGVGLLLLISALISAAASWWHLDNLFGRAAYSFFYGAVGRLAILTPVLLAFFAFRFFKSPDDKAANGRIIIGSLLLITSSTALVHIINPTSVGTGATAMREGGGWIGYGISTPLVALVTDILAIPILILIFLFSLLVVTATPLSSVMAFLGQIFGTSRAKITSVIEERREKRSESFEISETPPFESPLVQEFVNHPDQSSGEDEPIDEEDFDQEFTVEIPKSQRRLHVRFNSCSPQPILMCCLLWISCAAARPQKVKAKQTTPLLNL